MRRACPPRLVVLAAALCATVTTTASAAEPAARPLHGDLLRGKELYDAHCLDCHGVSGMGGKDGPRLADSGRLNALSNARFLDIIREGDSTRPKKSRHAKLPADLSLLDAWDVIGFLRFRTVEVQAMFPEADRYVAGPYTPDEHGLERIKATSGKAHTAEDSALQVITVYKTGWPGTGGLQPNDPKILDKLKRKFKIGYLVAVPLSGQERPTDVIFAMDPKSYAILGIRALASDGSVNPELDKQLSRFVGKGDRRTSGNPKNALKAGGGGKAFQALEGAVTEAFVRAAESVTQYEVAEKDRSWADDEF